MRRVLGEARASSSGEGRDKGARHRPLRELTPFRPQPVTSGGVTYREQPWHRECFVCTACKKPLSGQRFTSRDEFAYCLGCFCDLYAKKCAGCASPISGECPVPGPHHRLPLVWLPGFGLWVCSRVQTLGRRAPLPRTLGALPCLPPIPTASSPRRRYFCFRLDSLQTAGCESLTSRHRPREAAGLCRRSPACAGSALWVGPSHPPRHLVEPKSG